MKTLGLLVSLTAITVAGCSFDASRRPIQPAPVATHDSQSYCCASCQVDGELATCDQCVQVTSGDCGATDQRLLCVSNRIEEPESTTSYRVTCF